MKTDLSHIPGESDRNIYAEKALDQIPRLLGNMDRNPFSPTYGCFHRDYWLDKTSDFPDAVRQFAVHALALVYEHDFPGNIYRGSTKIMDWTIAGLEFWAGIQHRDGTFDEFYPNERGWVGPTAFTAYTSIEALNIAGKEMPPSLSERVADAIRRAAVSIIKGESEEDHLANHHAMACLAVWKAYELLGDPVLRSGFDKVWDTFLSYHNSGEGWSREYDGTDPGYLSATVSFLGKIYKSFPDPDIFEVLKQSVEFASYFVYPNGYYAGSLGSRNTLHFYPHGFEILADRIPLAASVAEAMLKALGEGKLVPPSIVSDRYVVYRVPEFLLSYLDYSKKRGKEDLLPYRREPFTSFFHGARIFTAVRGKNYIIANLAKGGVTKVFDSQSGALTLNDCGVIGKLENGKVLTSQWIDPGYSVQADDNGWTVSGKLQYVPSNKLFTPVKNIIFRVTLILFAWNPGFAHWLKGQIRRVLALGQRPSSVRFERSMDINSDRATLRTVVTLEGRERFSNLQFSGEFFVRYVPQSRYFQPQELDITADRLSAEELELLNSGKRIERTIELPLAGRGK